MTTDHAPTSHLLYVDESGHGGHNYLDNDQPFHVAGALLIRRQHLAGVSEAIAKAAGSGEWKTSSKNRSGGGASARLVRELGSRHAVPFWVAMDRRFAIAGKLIDVFADPMHNPSASWLSTWAIEQRQEAAERANDILSPATLENFARAYRQPSAEVFRDVAWSCAAEFHAHGEKELAATFEVAAQKAEEIARQETMDRPDSNHGDWAAPNMPSLCHLLKAADRLLELTDGDCHVIHDESLQFAVPMRWAFNNLRDMPSHLVHGRTAGGNYMRLGLTRCLSLTFSDSTADPCLQGADLIAGAVARVLRKIVRPAPLTRAEEDLARLLLAPLVLDDMEPLPLGLAGLYAHRRTINRVKEVLIRLGPIEPMRGGGRR